MAKRQRSEREKERARERAKEHYARKKADPEAWEQLLAYNRKWRKENPDKMAEYAKDWRARNPEKRRAAWVKSKYKLTDEQYQEILDHDGVCDSCGKNPATHIDHDHESGRYRGYLCRGCNWAAGHIGDDPQRLRDLADYLERTSGLK